MLTKVTKMTLKAIPISVQQLILIALFFSLALPGCSQKPLKPSTIRVCDSSGCSDRPGDYSSFDPSAADSEDDSDQQIPMLEELARKDPRAAYDLGLRFFRGDGVRQDSYQALKWMRVAAEKGDLDAQKALGRFYLTGLEEMGADSREAHKWLSLAASRGDNEAKELLKEATIAKQDDEYYSAWHNRWQRVFYNNWYSGYSYRHYWRNDRWYYRY